MLHVCPLCVPTASVPKFRSSIDEGTGVVRIFVPDGTAEGGEDFLVCSKLWDMAAANVACKQQEPL